MSLSRGTDGWLVGWLDGCSVGWMAKLYGCILQVALQDLDEVDINSDSFKALPLEIQHELIIAIQDKNRVNHWNECAEMPQVVIDRTMKSNSSIACFDPCRKLVASQITN